MNKNPPAWVKTWQRLLINNFLVNTDYSHLRDRTVMAVRKVDESWIFTYVFDNESQPVEVWEAELITAHRIIGVEEVK